MGIYTKISPGCGRQHEGYRGYVNPRRRGMSKRVGANWLSVLAVAGILLVSAGTSRAATYTYTGNAAYAQAPDGSCGFIGNNGTTNWDDPKNWGPPCQPAGVPGAGDTANVGQGVNLQHDTTVAGLNLSGGFIAGNGFTITITNSFNWSGGNFGDRFNGSAKAAIAPTGTGVLTGTANTQSSVGSLNNQGTLIWKGPGYFAFDLANSGTFDLQADGTFNPSSAGGTGFIHITNTGIIKKSVGTGSTTFGATQLNNAGGTIDVQTGTLVLAPDANYGGQGSALHEGSRITGAGILEWDQGSLGGASAADTEWSGTTTITGTLQLGNSAQNIGPGVYLFSPVTLTGSGRLEWQGGGFQASSLTFAPGFTVNASGALSKSASGDNFTNAGTINYLGGGALNASYNPLNNSGTFNCQAAGIAFSGGFNNTGTLNTVPGGTTQFDGNLTNSGVINVGGAGAIGILAVFSGGGDALVQTTTGHVNLDIGGTAAGTQFDQIQALSNANSATYIKPSGALDVHLINGFTPTSSQSFDIIHAFPDRAGVNTSGTFATITRPFHASYTTNDVTLSVPPPAPTISGFSPGGGPVGSTVTITGSHFSGATMVHFASTMATSFSILSDTQIRVTVPSGATSGKISVITPGGTATSSTNFTVGFIISGRIANALGGVPGVRVVRSGSSTVVYTNSNGEYSFNGLAAGTYAITPSLSGYLFTPTSKSVTLSTANVTQNFTATAQGHSISGRVVTPAGAPVVGVRVLRSGSSVAVFTNSIGNFSFANVAAGTYTITPRLTGLSFTPNSASATVTATTGAVGIHFKAISIAPTVRSFLPASGSPGTAVTITGTNLRAAAVHFTGAPAVSGVSSPDGTTLRVIVPSLAKTGPVGITTPNGSVTMGVFTVLPRGASAIAMASSLALSSISISVVMDSVTLRFSGALEADSASDTNHYTVEVNGRSVIVESAGYNADTHSVTLGLSTGSLHIGDVATVRWSGVLDTHGNTVAGLARPLAAF